MKKKTGDVFDAILQIPPKIMPDAKMDDKGWWSFTGPHGKARLKFNENKSFCISSMMDFIRSSLTRL